ncbi:hypothetical protein K438DRAFT_1788960 [Mycena galopus ATCC 62051]|nr:hypothetical protein K438DRAFT_1788960 [Mycena galopus ATCC 62051]
MRCAQTADATRGTRRVNASQELTLLRESGHETAAGRTARAIAGGKGCARELRDARIKNEKKSRWWTRGRVRAESTRRAGSDAAAALREDGTGRRRRQAGIVLELDGIPVKPIQRNRILALEMSRGLARVVGPGKETDRSVLTVVCLHHQSGIRPALLRLLLLALIVV